MKKIFTIFLLLVLVFNVVFAVGYSYVNGYYKSNGTYVNGYYKTKPNNTKVDNWSSKGNTNPFTNQKGYKSYY